MVVVVFLVVFVVGVGSVVIGVPVVVSKVLQEAKAGATQREVT